MSLVNIDKDRKVIPRWRNIAAATALGELNSLGNKPPGDIGTPRIIPERFAAWEADNSILTAAELLEAAIVEGETFHAIEAAEYLLARPEPLKIGILNNAKYVLIRAGIIADNSSETSSGEASDEEKRSIELIRRLKQRLNDDPRNGLAWAEISRQQTILGQKKNSIDAMKRALMLYPTNRYLLRSASRLFVHWDEAEQAQWFLRKNRRAVQRDPWLLSADLVVNEILGRTSLLIKDGIETLSDHSFNGYEISELASAIATIELGSGTLKKARKYFKQSLNNPTENSVAQAGWAARHNQAIDLEIKPLEVSHTFEASSWEAVRLSEWGIALNNIAKWSFDEPFSSRPLILGGYISTTVLFEPERTEQMMRLGLKSNPSDFLLANNLVVALALQNKIDDARTEFSKIILPNAGSEEEVTHIATHGLIEFRSGNPEEGRRLYGISVDLSRDQGLSRDQSLALLCWAQEEAQWDRERSDQLILEAEAVPGVLQQTDIVGMATRLRNESENRSENRIVYQFNHTQFGPESSTRRIISDDEDNDSQIIQIGRHSQ